MQLQLLLLALISAIMEARTYPNMHSHLQQIHKQATHDLAWVEYHDGAVEEGPHKDELYGLMGENVDIVNDSKLWVLPASEDRLLA